MSSQGESGEGVEDGANMNEFGEVLDKTGCSVWDELWGLEEVFQEAWKIVRKLE